MNTDQIFSNISKHITLAEKEKQHFKGLLSEEIIQRNEFILQQGEACNHIYFVNEGSLRAFYLNANGKDSTIMFAIEDWWITDMSCFLNELPAVMNIQAIAPSHVLKLSKANLDLLYQEVPEFNKFFRILMQNAYCREQQRMIQNLSLPAKGRYESFLRKYPKVAKMVTLKQIASYLGVTPEFLSTIRGSKN
ncbi:Crp/Fnr family transcriptional regulator [Fulvivirga ligni]|uniref:Crp/Fnr family transcriptional regulator n=1 Tax=Fulvivirga ligni TaxID=2904246 RepID=UPI001F454A06|nr:Crp/Fnr family transcriptional regulator [Fulvivirga ligni]UII18983.1 Crp/Fnr family transcriptional regulator [Fulvivirga ligni]